MQNEILNLETLMQIIGSSKEDITSFFELFKAESGLDIQELKKYIQEKNFAEIAKMAHKLKSTYGSIGSKTGYEILVNLEKAAKENEEFGIIDSLFEKYLDINEKIKQEFENYIKD